MVSLAVHPNVVPPSLFIYIQNRKRFEIISTTDFLICTKIKFRDSNETDKAETSFAFVGPANPEPP